MGIVISLFTFDIHCTWPTISAAIKHVLNLHAEVTVQMPAPLKSVIGLRKGYADKYRWSASTSPNGWIYFAHWVAGVWAGWSVFSAPPEVLIRSVALLKLSRRAQEQCSLLLAAWHHKKEQNCLLSLSPLFALLYSLRSPSSSSECLHSSLLFIYGGGLRAVLVQWWTLRLPGLVPKHGSVESFWGLSWGSF